MGPLEPRGRSGAGGAERHHSALGVAGTNGRIGHVDRLRAAPRFGSSARSYAIAHATTIYLNARPNEETVADVPTDADAASPSTSVVDAVSLADERCEVCRPGMPHLTDEESSSFANDIDASWEIIDGHGKLRRRVTTGDFGESMALAVRIGYVAEAEGHHPDLHVHWGRLVIDVTTHAAKGLTRNDFVLAAKIDRLLTN
jgi:4a-hydroxytetrahydrobiopterin dehydratase